MALKSFERKTKMNGHRQPTASGGLWSPQQRPFVFFHKNDRNDDKTNNHKKQQQHHHCLGFGIGHASFPSSVWLSTFLSKTLTVLPSAVPRCPESAHVKTESTNGLEEPEMSEPVLTAQLQQYMKW